MHFSSQIAFWPCTALELTLNYVAQRSPKLENREKDESCNEFGVPCTQEIC